MFGFLRHSIGEHDDSRSVDLEPCDDFVGTLDSVDSSIDKIESRFAAQEREERAASDIHHDEVLRGQRWSDGGRKVLIERRVRELEVLDQWVSDSVAIHRMQLEAEFRDREIAAERHQELIDTVERGNVVAKAVDFATAHPFMTALFGSALLSTLRGGRR